MFIDEAIKTLRYEIDEECHCDYIANEIRVLISAYESLKAQEEKSHQYCKNVCEPKYKADKEALINGQETLQKHITEQQAEIERLEKLLDAKCDRCIAKDRAEAIKEFAEKAIKLLRAKAFKLRFLRSLYTSQSAKALDEAAENIDNLLKELEEK